LHCFILSSFLSTVEIYYSGSSFNIIFRCCILECLLLLLFWAISLFMAFDIVRLSSCISKPSPGEWCWITNDSAMSLTLRYACFYGPLWVSFLVASCAHFFVWRSLQHFEALAQSAQDLRTTVATAGASDNACSSKNFRNLRSSVLASQQPPPTTNTTAPLPGEPSAVVQRVRASLRHYPVIFLVAWVPASTFRIAQDLGFFGLNGRDEGDALALSLFTAL